MIYDVPTYMKTEKEVTCSSCNKRFKYESEKERHEKSHTPNFECKICNKTFSYISALRRHIKQHDRKHKVHCDKCGGAFKDAALLRRHMNYAHKGNYTCGECSSTFNSEAALKTHIISHKPKNERRYTCSHNGCTKSFNFKHHLQHHEMTHTNVKEHICNDCGKGFIQLHHLKTHAKTHEPNNAYYCNVPNCNKKFSNEYTRKRHVKAHKANIKLKNDDVEISENKILTAEEKIPNNKENKNGSSLSTPIETCDTKNQGNDLINTTKDNQEETENINEIVSCQIAIGGCLAESKNKCLCAQIYSQKDKVKVQSIMNQIHLDRTPGEMELNYSECNDCSCTTTSIGSKVNIKHSNMCEITYKISKDVPEIEYKVDGTIKIKETLETDLISTSNKYSEEKRNLAVPYYSCKAILGNCIATEDGKISENCLCAKMMVADDSLNSAEIDEITPLNSAF